MIAVTDLTVAASVFDREHGLPSVEGGRHPGWGTANRIVRLGDWYLELVAVVDPREGAGSVLGRWVDAHATDVGRPIGWSVRPADLDSTARRLGLDPETGSRARPDGELVHWRTAGVDEAVAEPALPFFIERPPDTRFPGSLEDGEPVPASISRIELETDPVRLSTWLGENDVPMRVQQGDGGIARVLLNGSDGEIVLGAASSEH